MPAMVFTDASSAILLHQAGLFKLLTKTVCTVFAQSVHKEVTRSGYPGAKTFARAAQLRQVVVESCTDLTVLTPYPDAEKLDAGEKEMLGLFLSHTKGFILTDDGKAARICDKNNVPFINALLVPKLFWYAGHMDKKEYENQTGCLCKIGRYSDQIKKIAAALTPSDLSFFIREIK